MLVIFTKILIVCIGNICRSPCAERILKARLPDKDVTSAGLGALVGKGIDPSAAALLQQHGYDAENHQARKISGVMLNDADLVLVMEKDHQRVLMDQYPSFSGKVMLLGAWSNKEIHDPYRKSSEAFRYVFEQIDECCLDWCKKLGSGS